MSAGSIFRIEDGGRLLSQLCLSFTAFIPKAAADFDATAAFEIFWKKFSKDIGWFSVNGNSADKPVDTGASWKRAVEKSLSVAGRRGASVLVRGGDARAWGLPFFELWSGPSPSTFGVLRISFSDRAFEVSELIDFLSDISAAMPFSSAHCGHSIFWNQLNVKDRARMSPNLRSWALDYPGLMNSFAATGAVPAAHGLVDIGWVTLLGIESAAIARASDIGDRLLQLRPSGVEIRDLHDGSMMIRSAPRPELLASNAAGDVENRYRIGEVMRPLWNESENSQQVVPGFDSDSEFAVQAKWINRFFLPRNSGQVATAKL